MYLFIELRLSSEGHSFIYDVYKNPPSTFSIDRARNIYLPATRGSEARAAIQRQAGDLGTEEAAIHGHGDGVVCGSYLRPFVACAFVLLRETSGALARRDSVESELFFSVILISFSLNDIRERENVSDSVMECE